MNDPATVVEQVHHQRVRLRSGPKLSLDFVWSASKSHILNDDRLQTKHPGPSWFVFRKWIKDGKCFIQSTNSKAIRARAQLLALVSSMNNPEELV